MTASPKVMPSILLSCPTTSEMEVGAMAVEFEPSHQYPITFCCRVPDGSRRAVDKMVFDMEVSMEERSITEFLHVKMMAPIDIY